MTPIRLRARFLKAALVSALIVSAAGFIVPAANGAARTVDYTWHSFFDVPIVEDAWAQRDNIGFQKLRSKAYPVTMEATSVDGPHAYAGISATSFLYAPARLKITARNLDKVTVDTIGGVNSPAPAEQRVGLAPYDL
ncbi:MAG: hypothetical protein NTW86_15360, partial [Candidatus Sumerlaeota bacterium]|nr:hypothetical protein [Candidatus Sumerlaeota bacterium]